MSDQSTSPPTRLVSLDAYRGFIMLAMASGGVYYPIHRLEDLQRAYDAVVLQLRTAYTITYASNSTPAGGRHVRVLANRDGASVRLSPVVNLATP